MSNLLGNVQDKFKSSTNAVALMTIKFVTGLFLGLTMSLIGQQIIGYGWISFLLVITIVTGAVLRITRNWPWMHLMIFNLICVLIGMVLRMYILIAPG